MSTLEEVKLYQKTRNGLTSCIYNCQKKNAISTGKDKPNYTMLELREWIFLQKNFENLYQAWVDSSFNKELRPSCDRKNDYIGYKLDNLELMTWKENRDKGARDCRNGTNNKKNRKVYQLDLNRKIIAEHYSMNSASRLTGAGLGNIYSCCIGKYKSAGGFKWCFV